MTFPLARYNLNQSLKHLVQVKVYVGATEIDIPVEAGTLTFDEDNEFITASIQTPVPDWEITQLIDPRTLPEMRIYLGYELQGTTEIEEICRLDVRERIIDRPENLMVLTAMGREGRIHDTCAYQSTLRFDYKSDAGVSLRALIEKHDPGATVIETLPPEKFLFGDEVLEEEIGVDPWGIIQEILDRVGAVAYWDGFYWRIHKDAAPTSQKQIHLTTGPTGLIKQYQARLGRDDLFYNSVHLTYRWNNSAGEEQEIKSFAQIVGGPLGVTAAGRKNRSLERNKPASSTSAANAAQTLVNRTITRGREIIVTAVSAYWLRPFQTIEITNVPGEAETHLVKYVQFTLESGEMNIKTRRPEDVEIV